MEINKRIIALIEILGLAPGEFADKIGVQRSGISHITSGRNKPSLDFLERTLTIFPEINSEWLVLGKGKPLKYQAVEEKREEIPFSMGSGSTENQPSLLFPFDDFEEKTEVELNKSDLEEKEKVILRLEEDEKYKEDGSNSKGKEKKEIRKIIVLYTDNSFEVYEN